VVDLRTKNIHAEFLFQEEKSFGCVMRNVVELLMLEGTSDLEVCLGNVK
jgi:hypothetical protein